MSANDASRPVRSCATSVAAPSSVVSTSATPRPAATVMLLRETGATVEVLAIRRHEQLAFMGGLWVFPGGSVSPADISSESLARIPQGSQARCSQFADLYGT